MLFKSVASLSRPGTVAKTLWPTTASGSQTGQQKPSFFVSTPQYKRQQSQVACHSGEGRRSSKHRSTLSQKPYVVVSSGPNFSTTSAVQSLDDDQRDELEIQRNIDVQHKHLNNKKGDSVVKIGGFAESKDLQQQEPEPEQLQEEPEAEQLQEKLQEQPQASEIIQTTNESIMALQKLGDHQQVLDIFASLESEVNGTLDIPVEIYNKVLHSLACLSLEASDISVLLQGYQQLLQQGIKPNKETYAIVVSALVDFALQTDGKRQKLRLVLGPPNELESVDEVYEHLAFEDHLKLAMEILKASISVTSDNLDSQVLNKVLEAAAKLKVPVDSMLLKLGSANANANAAILRLQTTSSGLESAFKGMPKTYETIDAYINSLFNMNMPDKAVEVYKSTSPNIQNQLLESVVVGFAQVGLVSTAFRWIRRSDLDLSLDSKAKVLQAMCCEGDIEHLATAALLYEHLAVQKAAAASKEFSLARSSYTQLVAQGLDRFTSPASLGVYGMHHKHVSFALRSVLKETDIRKAVLDPSAVMAATKALINDSNIDTALSFFSTQSQRLADVWTEMGLKTYVGQEMLALVVEELPELNVQSALALSEVPFLF